MKYLSPSFVVATIVATFILPTVLKADEPYTIETLRAERQTAKWQDRGLIYNNDGGDMLYGETHTPQGLLDVRTSGLIGSQLDTLFYGVDTVGMVYYDSQVSEVFTTTGGHYENNMTQDLLNQGTDALEVMTNFSRQNDIEIFASLRMNDTHDRSGDRLTYAFPEVKNNPGWIIGTTDDNYGAWSAFDFSVQGVRDLTLDIFTEMCTNYDIDGIELDFFRHHYFFRSHTTGGTATAADRAMMTQLVSDIRTMTEQVGLQRGKPILVSVRVPDSVEYSSDVGLDVVEWLDQDLVDMMTVTGYFRAEEWSESVALGHQYDVPVYACLSESRMSGEAGEVRDTTESYYARAAGALEEGVDGIYMFNYFNDESELWNVVGDPETLQGTNKVYTTGARGLSYMNSGLAGGISYLNREVVSPEKPLDLEIYQPQTISLTVGDNLTGLTESDVRVLFRLRVDNIPASGGIFARIGSTWLEAPTINGNYLDFSVSPNLLAQGINQLTFTTTVPVGNTARVNDLQLWINYRPTGTATPFLYEPFCHSCQPIQVEVSMHLARWLHRGRHRQATTSPPTGPPAKDRQPLGSRRSPTA